MTTPIPQPPGYPILGNITDVDPKQGIASIRRLSKQYGEIFKLSILGSDRYFLCSERLVREACDETKFQKSIGGALEQVRNGTGAGLFTAYHGEHDWEVAHRVLTPAFGPLAIQNSYFEEMKDISVQLVSKWARLDSEPIHVTDDFTRLTLDSIALCAMDKRFNSFYKEEMHPFVTAMTEFLLESGARTRKTRLEMMLNSGPTRQYERNIALMRSVAQEAIDRRKENPTDKKDLLNAILYGEDPKTRERLSNESQISNMITMLIAGHETTSGMLSFTTFYLLKNPEALQRAQAEVDEVLGQGSLKVEHIAKLPYIEAILRESLRLSPTASAFAVTPKTGTKDPVLLGGEYLLPPNATIVCFLPVSQCDPSVYGPDADEFVPERMLSENFAKLPGAAWKPFGNGARGCIGRPFAWQEAIMALALILQNFNIRFANPYELQIKQTLTIKPDNFFIKAALRPGIDPVGIEKRLFGSAGVSGDSHEKGTTSTLLSGDLKPMTILYGSNSGTCEGLSQKLALASNSQGFSAIVKSLDSAVDQFPLDQPVIIISASYEGLPPDNAGQFTQWLKTADAGKFNGARYAVFGCGHRDWVATYQKIPTLYDQELNQRGAQPLLARGETNVAAGAIFDDFDNWSDKLWSTLGGTSTEVAQGLDMELSSSTRASHLNFSVQDALVLKNDLLTPEGIVPEKRFIEFRLPSKMTYETGDYIATLPINDFSIVSRILSRFGLPWDATMRLKKNAHSTIPTETELSVSVVLASYVENAPATKKNIQTLENYLENSQLGEVASNRQTVLDILEANPSLQIPFSVYLSMLPPMRIRQYSISSSPLSDSSIASITFSLANDGTEANSHPGVATNYLKKLKPGSIAQLSIRKSPAPFHPPSDPSVPVIMICAGTGIAPFRGFVADRAVRLASSKTPADFAPAVLIAGCRDPSIDALHAEQFAEWEKAGAVKIYYAYSRVPEKSQGCKYAQERLWHERKEVIELFEQGAKVYICGSSKLGKGVTDVVTKMAVVRREESGSGDATEESAKAWWEGLRNERYAVDVFD